MNNTIKRTIATTRPIVRLLSSTGCVVGFVVGGVKVPAVGSCRMCLAISAMLAIASSKLLL